MKLVIPILLFSALSSQATVIWQPAPNAVSSASWDVWSFAPPIDPVNGSGLASGSQGAAQQTTGSLVTSSDVVTNVIDSYGFPGGLGSNPDTYYFHTGGATWDASVGLSQNVSHVRVSYSLLGFGGSPASDYALTPIIPGATPLGGGTYSTDDGLILGTVFYQDFELAAPQSSVQTTFGDIVFPGFPGSFRSVDGVQVEVFNATPIPEPSSSLFLLASGLFFLRRRK